MTAIFLILCAGFARADSGEIPAALKSVIAREFSQYHVPGTADFTPNSDWATFAKGQTPYLASGDFDGDAQKDTALLLAGAKSDHWIQVVFVRKGTTYRAYPLVTSPDPSGRNHGPLQRNYLKTKACGRKTCLESGVYETSSRLYHWDGAKFVPEQTGD